MVVLVFSSVDSQDPEHDKNHGPGVDQRTHCWAATHTAAARVEAKRFGWFRFGSRRSIFENRTREESLKGFCLYSVKISVQPEDCGKILQ